MRVKNSLTTPLKPRLFRAGLRSSLLFITLLVVLLALTPKTVQASCPCGVGCAIADCIMASITLAQNHQSMVQTATDEFDADLDAFEQWLIDDFLNAQVIPAMAAMTNQMNAVAMQYTQIIGGFLDAKTQMETQRLFQKLKIDAHKDYIPSQDFCTFGTNTRSLAATESKVSANSVSLSNISIGRQLGTQGGSGAQGVEQDLQGRWEQFVHTYCSPKDNNFIHNNSGDTDGTGLSLACDHDGPGGSDDAGGDDLERINRDVDYTRLIDEPRTMETDFTDSNASEPQEVDVIAMSKNLYGHRLLSRSVSSSDLNSIDGQKLYMMLRGIAARRSIAQNSFSAIVAFKSTGTSKERTLGGDEAQTQRYMASIMRELMSAGTNDDGDYIFELIGDSPSYYSQLEILAKRIYQNPDFYANLYDTPANVARKKVAMKAIELMVDRAMYESQLRREMSVSVLLSSKLRPLHRDANKQ